KTQFKDFDEPYRALDPVISGLQSAYAGFASGTPEGLTLTLSPQALAAASGAVIVGWQWTIPASGVTVVSGALTQRQVGLRFDPASTEYWVKVTATDDGGRTGIFWFPVWSHNDINPPALGFTAANISRSLDGGSTPTLTAFDGVNNLLDGTLIVIWSQEFYNGTETNIFSNIDAVCRLRRESDES
ncbi:MAG: hypothetical protein CUN54_09560, partial [Phototrophicales bacterium]